MIQAALNQVNGEKKLQGRLETPKPFEQILYWSQNIASKKQDTVKWAKAATDK